MAGSHIIHSVENSAEPMQKISILQRNSKKLDTALLLTPHFNFGTVGVAVDTKPLLWERREELYADL